MNGSHMWSIWAAKTGTPMQSSHRRSSAIYRPTVIARAPYFDSSVKPPESIAYVRAPRPRQAVQLLQAPPRDEEGHVRLPQPRWSMRTEEEGFDAREFTPSDRRPPVPFTPGRAPSKIVVSVCCGDSASRECLMTAAAENR